MWCCLPLKIITVPLVLQRDIQTIISTSWFHIYHKLWTWLIWSFLIPAFVVPSSSVSLQCFEEVQRWACPCQCKKGLCHFKHFLHCACYSSAMEHIPVPCPPTVLSFGTSGLWKCGVDQVEYIPRGQLYVWLVLCVFMCYCLGVCLFVCLFGCMSVHECVHIYIYIYGGQTFLWCIVCLLFHMTQKWQKNCVPMFLSHGVNVEPDI